MADEVTVVDQPTNKWNVKVNVTAFTSQQFLDLLNAQGAIGNTDVVTETCADGRFAFFGNYWMGLRQ